MREATGKITAPYEEVKEEVRRRQLRILDTVAGLCEREGLEYWLDAGTLLGAVRHGGYIPWDDDIDIGLMRKDYEKLLRLLERELPDDMVLQTASTDPLYGFMFAKVRDRHSHIHGEIEYTYNGVFIDVFPFDPISRYPLVRAIQRRIIGTAVGLRYAVRFRPRRVWIKKILKRLVDRNFVYFPLYRAAMALDRLGTDSALVGNGLVCPWAFDRSVRKADVYLPTSRIRFEGAEFRAPADPDRYLRALYGSDYMTPRKESHRAHLENVTLWERR